MSNRLRLRSAVLGCFGVLLLLTSPVMSQSSFIRGDCNGDGDTTFYVPDAARLVCYLFSSGPIHPCEDACDANDDGVLDIVDAVDILMAGSSNPIPLPAPYPHCGVDNTPDSLGCSTSPCPNLPGPPLPDSDYTLSVTTTAGSVGGTVPASVQLTLGPGAFGTAGFSFALCHDSAELTLVEATVNPSFGDPPAFVDLFMPGDSLGLAVLPDFFGHFILNAGQSHDLVTLEYVIEAPTDTQLTFCSAAGSHSFPSRVDLYCNGIATPVTNDAVVPIARFTRGDCNGNTSLEIGDAVEVLTYLFSDPTPPGCFDACDANDDGDVDIADAVKILGVRFLAGAPLPPPVDCDPDPTSDTLPCETPPC